MGIHITGYSNVTTQSIPNKYRGYYQEQNKDEIEAELQNYDKDNYKDNYKDKYEMMEISSVLKQFYMDRHNITYKKKGIFNIPPLFKVDETSYKWNDDLEEQLEKDKDSNIRLIYTEWVSNIMYLTSDESEREECCMSNSGYDEMIDEINTYYNGDIDIDIIIKQTERYFFIYGEKIGALYSIFTDIYEEHKNDISELNIYRMEYFIKVLEKAKDCGGILIS